MRKELLLKFADELDGLQVQLIDQNAIRWFDMTAWKSYAESDINVEINGIECNTAGCAIGWFPILMPKACARYSFTLIKEDHRYFPVIMAAKNVLLKGWEAIEYLFNLHSRHVELIFDALDYTINSDEITPKIVANRIREFVNRETQLTYFDGYAYYFYYDDE